MSELPDMLPCPFCGGGAKVLKSWLIGPCYTPTCDGPNECPGQNMEQDEQGGFAADYATELEAIVAWNTRDTAYALAMVAAAYEDAAVIALSCVHLTPDPDKCIRARVPENAQAALAAHDREVRNKVLSELRNKWIVRDLTEDDFAQKEVGQ